MLEPQKLQRLQELAKTLASQAQQLERKGESEEAIKIYTKLVEIFVLLSKDTGDNSLWLKYTRQAETYHKKIDSLAESPSQLEANDGDVYSRGKGRKSDEREDESRPSKDGGPLRRILRSFQKSGSDTEEESQQGKGSSTSRDDDDFWQDQSQFQAGFEKTTRQNQFRDARYQPAEARGGVPYDLFQEILVENKSLKEKLESTTKEMEGLVASLESENKKMKDQLAATVPRSKYEDLSISNQASLEEVEQLKRKLNDSVPKAQYDELLAKVSSMVPREVYVEAEIRAAKLEIELGNSVPKNVLESLASEVSLLSTLSSIPLKSDYHKQGDPAEEDEEKKTEQSQG